jgi:hypothetical protein
MRGRACRYTSILIQKRLNGNHRPFNQAAFHAGGENHPDNQEHCVLDPGQCSLTVHRGPGCLHIVPVTRVSPPRKPEWTDLIIGRCLLTRTIWRFVLRVPLTRILAVIANRGPVGSVEARQPLQVDRNCQSEECRDMAFSGRKLKNRLERVILYGDVLAFLGNAREEGRSADHGESA